MCRFTLYLGPPVRLSTLLIEPSHSLIQQSFHAEERSEPLNGDGFGVGWYAPGITPVRVRQRRVSSSTVISRWLEGTTSISTSPRWLPVGSPWAQPPTVPD